MRRALRADLRVLGPDWQLVNLGQQARQAVDLDVLVGVDVADEQVDLRLDAALLKSAERALDGRKHDAVEDAIDDLRDSLDRDDDDDHDDDDDD